MFGTNEMEINMGPQHPSTHGVLRLKLKLDGERVVETIPYIGYLHRGCEKLGEDRTYPQAVVYTDRMDTARRTPRTSSTSRRWSGSSASRSRRGRSTCG